jgi:hypothetical protein
VSDAAANRRFSKGAHLRRGRRWQSQLAENHLNPLTMRNKSARPHYECEAVGDLFRALQSCAIIRQQGP